MSEHPTATPSLSNARVSATNAANALTAALNRPYGQQNWPAQRPVSEFWRSGVTQGRQQTAEGYTLSSTYRPAAIPAIDRVLPLPEPNEQLTEPLVRHPPNSNRPPAQPVWLTPGHHPCAYPGCAFKASQRSAEIHMMDRHLIHSAGWKEEKSWDADTSLKGKAVPISGTATLLDTPQAVEEWVADRQRKWPSERRVAAKAALKTEALERGELEMDTLKSSSKRRRVDPYQTNTPKTPSHRTSIYGNPICPLNSGSLQSRRAIPESMPLLSEGVAGDGSSSDDDGPPEEIHSVLPTAVSTGSGSQLVAAEPNKSLPESISRRKVHAKDRGNHRHGQSNRHIFPSGCSPLLQRLLSPEIRHTVSNLSQAIHFIVENDFFDGVELHPGDSANRNIQVLAVQGENYPFTESE